MIQELIDKKIKELNDLERKNRVGSGKWKPSNFGACYRKQWYAKTGEPQSNPPDENGLRRFYVGKMFHEFVQQFFDRCDIELLIETDAVKGFADIITSDEVVDIKSVHSHKFWHDSKAIKEGKSVLNVLRHYWLQVGWYAVECKKKACRLVLVSKDDLCVAEYVMPTEHIKPLIDEEIDALSKIKSCPEACPRLFLDGREKDKECNKYCSWRDLCKGKK